MRMVSGRDCANRAERRQRDRARTKTPVALRIGFGVALLVAALGAAACSERDSLPDEAAEPSVAAPSVASSPDGTPSPAIARHCIAPTSTRALHGPGAPPSHDLDLQLHWRAATVCQELHALEQEHDFGPLERLAIRAGEGHRVLLLLPSLDGVASVARYRVTLSDDADAELIAWLTLEESAAANSDGVEYAVGVAESETNPASVPLRFERLTRDQAAAGWLPVRVDLSRWRGKDVWVVLASREPGDRSGDWLLWGDPRIVTTASGPAIVDPTDADPARLRTLTTVPWSEANVFKAYSGFNEDRAEALNPTWVKRMFPWLGALRLFASLGGSFGPTLARDYESQMGHNPTRDSREERRWAEYYEFFRDGPDVAGVPVRERFDWTRFDTLYDRIASTGVRMHINLAGAPELFTGGRGHYHTYHFNEMPIVDEQGWKTYVDEVFRHLSQQPWFPRAGFSFFSEANCRWVARDGTVRHFGYQGDAAQHARQYLWTWQAMKPYVRPGQVHFGPFVVEPDPAVPATDNLPEFLRLVRETFAAAGEPLPPWSAFAFNIYESPQLPIDQFVPYKIDYVRQLLPVELPGLDLPLRFDEVGIHPLITSGFAAAGVPDFEGSRWAAAWHAEMLALLVEQRIAVGSPWLHNALMRPYGSYVFASLASGTFVPKIANGGALDVAPAPATPRAVQVALASLSPQRIGALSSTGADGVTRVLLWQIPRAPASDQRLTSDAARTPVRVRIAGCATRCTVSVLGYDDQVFGELSGEPAGAELTSFAAMPALPRLRRVTQTVADELALALAPGEVYLLEIPTPEPS